MNILKILTEARKTGNFGERAAARYLKKNGYRIVRKNYTAADAEIDIIARKGQMLSFVEVKARNINNVGGIESRPAASVTPEKQRKIIKCDHILCHLIYFKPSKPKKKRTRAGALLLCIAKNLPGKAPLFE